MPKSIKTLYVIHHSHTDIGYTDLQERVIETQIDYIKTVLNLMKEPENAGFRWNCETLFCVEGFFESASEEEKQEFLRLVKDGKLGLSANYLNFTDIADGQIIEKRVGEWSRYFSANEISMNAAMTADINGISMGQRDALINNGVEFLFTNVHCHHGMYPLYQNQNSFWWENADGQRILVWNGEHYNLGNVLGIKPNRTANFMMQNHLGNKEVKESPVEVLKDNLFEYLDLCEEYDYSHDFIVTSVSGVFSDNAPPETEILKIIEGFNSQYSDEVIIKMVSLQELYAEIKEKLVDSPVYKGDLTDWWAHGVGSTPYALKHYKEAQHKYHECFRLDKDIAQRQPELVRIAEDNLLLYAEHTWGHSSTITNPCDTMVLNLDIRKTSYASKAHEAASRILNFIAKQNDDILRYYNTNGEIEVHSTSSIGGNQLVEFYIENPYIGASVVKSADGKETLPCQISNHPRGKLHSFVDNFGSYEVKRYHYSEKAVENETLNSRKAYVGSDRVRDIVNDYDPVTYLLPFEYENQWFKLTYKVGNGITGVIDKRTNKNLVADEKFKFFTPMYECTKIDRTLLAPCPDEMTRRYIGRNIRGQDADLYVGDLIKVDCIERGEVFTTLKFTYKLEGTIHCCVFTKLYNDLPRIDYWVQIGKTISTDIESVFMPLTLDVDNSSVYLKKGGSEAFRPGIDQVPGTCMEYYVTDDGLAFVSDQGSVLVATKDTALIYAGEMEYHPILLCDGEADNNKRPVYSWIMNNAWETNFKMDLSGFCEYKYALLLSDETESEKAMEELKEKTYDPYVFIVK